MTSARVVMVLVLLCATLTGCDSVPQPPPGPQGSSAANWSNDFLRAESGIIWVVNATWTEGNKVIFRDQEFTPEQFRQMLSTQAGITTNTPISILQEPGVAVPAIEWQRFEEAGYKYTRFLSLPKRYWTWWRRTQAQITTANAGEARDKVCDPRLKVFAAQKRQQTDDLAATLDLTVPPEARTFFHAAETGNWRAVSNAFERIHSSPGPTGTNLPAPGLNNVLFIPIHETFGAYEQFNSWDGTLLQKYADDMLQSLPNGSIYFGGTAAGRFVITTVRDVANSPDIFILTQNWLGDARYTDYLRLLYGASLSIPSEQDVQETVQQCARDAQARQSAGQRSDTNDCCRSAEENMNINATLAKWIFDHNKAHHECYVEESYVIPWMFPYLEPHGLIMKLNNEPLAQLDPAVVARDHQYWDALTKSLLADPRFLRNERARQTYGKLRSALGGLYAYGRRMTNDAETVFKQAIELAPTNPEANFRLAQLYTEQGRIDDAKAVLELLQQHDPTNQKLQAAITQLQTLKQSGVRTTRWLTGPSFFRQGDSIIITDVRASSSEFKAGDTVKVTGRYTLSSKPRALLCLNVTTNGKGNAWEPQALEQELQVAQGSGEFALSATIQQPGHLHLTFYDVDTGNPFGGFYFGSGPQMQEIANWNVRRWYAKE